MEQRSIVPQAGHPFKGARGEDDAERAALSFASLGSSPSTER